MMRGGGHRTLCLSLAEGIIFALDLLVVVTLPVLGEESEENGRCGWC